MNYTNYPIYINSDTDFFADQYLFANNISFSNQPQLVPRRKLGRSIDGSLQFDRIGSLQSKISFNSYIDNVNTGSLNNILKATGNNSCNIKIGSTTYSGCYLDKYSILIDPFKAIILNADFIVTNTITGRLITGSPRDISDYDSISNNIIYGNNCFLSGSSQVINSNLASIKYSVSCSRSPSYVLGSKNNQSMFLNAVEKQIDILSTDLLSLIDYTGKALSSDLKIVLKNPNDVVVAVLPMYSGSSLSSQNINIPGGDTINTNITIKEIVL